MVRDTDFTKNTGCTVQPDRQLEVVQQQVPRGQHLQQHQLVVCLLLRKEEDLLLEPRLPLEQRGQVLLPRVHMLPLAHQRMMRVEVLLVRMGQFHQLLMI